MTKPGTQLLSVGKAASAHGVAVAALRRWHRQGRLLSALRTLGGHRRYASEAVRTASGAPTPAAGKTICYARVSSHDQREQLLTQAARLERHCHEAGFPHVEVVTKDRLLRFGGELLFQIFRFFGVEVVVLDATADVSREQQLTEDLVEILTSPYGLRSRTVLKALVG